MGAPPTTSPCKPGSEKRRAWIILRLRHGRARFSQKMSGKVVTGSSRLKSMRFMAKDTAAQRQEQSTASSAPAPGGSWAAAEPTFHAGEVTLPAAPSVTKRRLFRAVVDREGAVVGELALPADQPGVAGVLGRMSFAKFNKDLQRRVAAAAAEAAASPDVDDGAMAEAIGRKRGRDEDEGIAAGDSISAALPDAGARDADADADASAGAPMSKPGFAQRVGPLRPHRGGAGGGGRSQGHRGGGSHWARGPPSGGDSRSPGQRRG